MKKWIALTLCFTLLQATAFAGNRFTDTNEKWYEAAVQSLSGLLNGVENGRFDGERAITQAEFVTLLMRGLTATGENKMRCDEAVQKARENGLIEDSSDKNAAMTREKAMQMLQNAALFANYPVLMNAWNVSAYFDDLDELTAAQGAYWCLFNGIVRGCDRKLRPQDRLTRGEAAAMLSRFFQNAGVLEREAS